MMHASVPANLAFAASLLSACTSHVPPTPASRPDGNVERVLSQMERDWAKALITGDAAVLNRIVADDWSETSWDGTRFGKAKAIADLSSGPIGSENMDPIKVRVFNDMAIVTTGDREPSTAPGDNGSAHFVWTDVYLKRNGTWQVVSTQGSKLPHSK
jgi:hypothetical protein